MTVGWDERLPDQARAAEASERVAEPDPGWTLMFAPLDEQELAQLVEMTDPTLSALQLDRLESSPWADLCPMVQRLFAPRMGVLVTPANQNLPRACAAWALSKTGSLQTPLHLSPPMHSRLARAQRLQRTYRSARQKP